MTSKSAEGNGASIQSVELTVRVLRELANGQAGVTELARRMGELKMRLHRHLVTLKAAGFVAQDEAGQYRLGWGLVELGHAASAQVDLVAASHGPLRALTLELGLTTALCVPVERSLVIAHAVESEGMVAISLRKGLRVPRQGSAAGKLMDAFEAASGGKGPQAADVCYAENNTPLGINSVAGPVVDSNNILVAVVIAVGTARQLPLPPAAGLAASVLACAASVSRAIGSSGNGSTTPELAAARTTRPNVSAKTPKRTG